MKRKDMTQHRKLWNDYFPQFINCGDQSVQGLMDSAALVEITSGKQIFYPGKKCENYLLVIEGVVKTMLISEGGREVMLYHVCSGDSCILTTSCLLGGNCYPAMGITESQVTAFAISSHAFYRCIDQSPFFREFVFTNFSARLASVINRMEAVSFGTIDERLCKILLGSGNKVVMKTHQELASELGSAREVVSRHLKRFERYGWVVLGRGTVDSLIMKRFPVCPLHSVIIRLVVERFFCPVFFVFFLHWLLKKELKTRW